MLGALDLDQVRYAAAVLGHELRQIVVLAFLCGGGPDSAWEFELDGSLLDVRVILDRTDLPYRALIPTATNNTKVILIDFGNRKRKAVRELARIHRVRPIRHAGQGELLGQLNAQDTLTAARATRRLVRDGTAQNAKLNNAIWCDSAPSAAGSGIILLLGRKVQSLGGNSS